MPDLTMPSKPTSNNFTFNERSDRLLMDAHPDLQRLTRRALSVSEVPFQVHEVARTLEKQKEYLAKKLTTTLKSRHIPRKKQDGGNGVSHAVDVHPLINGEAKWDWPLFTAINKAFKLASKQLGIPYEWGGDWKTFPDGPHFQLPWASYPDNKTVEMKPELEPL